MTTAHRNHPHRLASTVVSCAESSAPAASAQTAPAPYIASVEGVSGRARRPDLMRDETAPPGQVALGNVAITARTLLNRGGPTANAKRIVPLT